MARILAQNYEITWYWVHLSFIINHNHTINLSCWGCIIANLKVILKSSGGRNMERLVSERVWPGYSGVNMDKGIPGRRKAEKMQRMFYAC